MTAPVRPTESALCEPHYLAEPLRRLAALMRNIGRPVDADELVRAAAVLPILEMANARLTHFQEQRLNPCRDTARKEWDGISGKVHEARLGVDWLHSHGCLPNHDSLLLRGVITVLRAAGRGERPVQLLRGAGEVLDRMDFQCAAVTLAEEEPFDADGWERGSRPTGQAAASARAAVAKLAQASGIRGYSDAEEQARIRLVEQARNLALHAAV